MKIGIGGGARIPVEEYVLKKFKRCDGFDSRHDIESIRCNPFHYFRWDG